MASLIYGNKLPLLQKGFRSRINDSEIVGKTLKDGEEAVFGDALYFVEGSEGIVSKTGTKFAGILCGTNVKMPSQYPAEADIKTKGGEALNCLVRGSIAVACADDVKEGDKAYVNAGVFTKTSGGVEIGIFTGVKEGGLVEVFVRR